MHGGAGHKRKRDSPMILVRYHRFEMKDCLFRFGVLYQRAEGWRSKQNLWMYDRRSDHGHAHASTLSKDNRDYLSRQCEALPPSSLVSNDCFAKNLPDSTVVKFVSWHLFASPRWQLRTQALLSLHHHTGLLGVPWPCIDGHNVTVSKFSMSASADFGFRHCRRPLSGLLLLV